MTSLFSSFPSVYLIRLSFPVGPWQDDAGYPFGQFHQFFHTKQTRETKNFVLRPREGFPTLLGRTALKKPPCLCPVVAGSYRGSPKQG
jgi:hypothetical protein